MGRDLFRYGFWIVSDPGADSDVHGAEPGSPQACLCLLRILPRNRKIQWSTSVPSRLSREEGRCPCPLARMILSGTSSIASSGTRFQRTSGSRAWARASIIDKEGFILTNNHVVEMADEIKVKLADEREFLAKIVGRDPKTDLALIKIDSDKPLSPLPLGDSDSLEVGEWVVAIGNPFRSRQHGHCRHCERKVPADRAELL